MSFIHPNVGWTKLCLSPSLVSAPWRCLYSYCFYYAHSMFNKHCCWGRWPDGVWPCCRILTCTVLCSWSRLHTASSAWNMSWWESTHSIWSLLDIDSIKLLRWVQFSATQNWDAALILYQLFICNMFSRGIFYLFYFQVVNLQLVVTYYWYKYFLVPLLMCLSLHWDLSQLLFWLGS